MTLHRYFERTGNWLFRWRSYLPLILLASYIIVLKDFQYPANNHKLNRVWEIVCLAVSFFGLFIRIITIGYKPKGTSGRNVKNQEAAVLNTTGMYSVVRHPLYVGNFFVWLGLSMFAQKLWFSIVILFVFGIYYGLIMFAEEEFLQKKFGELFINWTNETPAFFPKLANWQPSELPFSVKTVLKRESSSFFGIISAFTFLDIISETYTKGSPSIDTMWLLIFTVSLIIYIVLIILKKKKLLDVEGR
ncbi:MAG: isoprenylcysteine carboxylmethyltransferase family protein [Elusimicrobiota bacterium]